jgi:hypothetical protein
MSEALAPAAPPVAAGRLWKLPEFAAGLAAFAVLASLGVVVAGHLADRYRLNFVSGVYAGLAERLNDGAFYPALYDGEHYGGTRYMPLSFAPHAGLARLTGEYILSGKLLTLALSVILCVQLYRILRGFGCARGVALALAGAALLTNPGFLACTTIRGDLLPVVLQLAALQVARGGKSAPRAAVAGILCTLALLTKLTAAWAPLSVAGAYLIKDRRAAAVFLATWLGTLSAALAGLHYGTSGRMLDNFRAVSAAGVQGLTAFKAPVAMFARLGRGGAAEALLVPLALVGCVVAARRKQFTVYHAALLLALPITLAIFTDVGADYNHLLDVLVLAVPAAGSLWAALPAADRASAVLRAGLAAATCWVLFMGWTAVLGEPLREVVSVWRGQSASHYPAKPLAGLVGDRDALLSEDPWVAISRGQAPRVLDPCALAALTRTRPDLTDDLVRRIEAGAFDRVVLRQHDDEAEGGDDGEWQDRIFGRPILHAIRSRYRLQARAQGYCVYVPAEAGGLAEATAEGR